MNDKPKETVRANVLGVGISAINLDLAVAAVAEALERRAKSYICVTGVHGVSEAQLDPDFRAILNRSFLTTPDGMPMVWMGRWQGFRAMARVYGPDLMLRICEYSQSRGLTHFLYGGAPGVAEELKRRLEQRFPGLKIVGTYPALPAADGRGRTEPDAPRGDAQAGLLLGRVEHPEAGEVHGPLLPEAGRDHLLRRGCRLRLSCWPDAPGTTVDAA